MGCCGFVLILPYFLLWTDYFQFQININCVWFGKTYLWAVWVGQLVIRAVDLCCDRELTWALTYTTINGHWLTLQVTSRSEGELNDLLTSTPRVGLLTPGCLMTARKILFFLATDHRFSQPEDQDLTELIAADNNRLELLKSYHTDAINQTAYQLFKHWSHLAYMAVK